jgi:hypothetical protein
MPMMVRTGAFEKYFRVGADDISSIYQKTSKSSTSKSSNTIYEATIITISN